MHEIPKTLSVRDFPLYGSRLIEASAGTGKTYTIALLYVRLVLGHGAQNAYARALSPPEILVVTFTDAATQELRDRIRVRLREAALCFGDQHPAADDFESSAPHDPALLALREDYPQDAWSACARRLQLAAEWMDEAAVSTIHGWCLRMLREHAFDSGSLFQVTLKPDEKSLRHGVVRDYWRRTYYPLSAGAVRVVQQCFADPETLARALDALLARPAARLRHGNAALDADGSVADLLETAARAEAQRDATMQQARDAWRAARADLELLFGGLRPHMNRNTYRGVDEQFDQWLDALRAWSEGGAIPEKLRVFGASGIKLKGGHPVPVHPALDAIDAALAVEPMAGDLPARLLVHALPDVRAALSAEKDRRAELGFDDLLQRLDQALMGEGGASLAARIRTQFPVALIDEFQDTDPIQYRIFDRIYRIVDSQPDCGVFMIGDPKQAIYSFRGADIHTYLRARDATAGRHYTLGTNFRSTQALVQAVNQCFVHAERQPRGAFRYASAQHGNRVPFHAVQAKGRSERLLLGGRPAQALTFWYLDGGDAPVTTGAYRREMAARAASAVGGWLRGAASGDSALVDLSGQSRRLQPADIAVLVRDGTEASAIRDALSDRGMASVYLSDRDSVFASAEAQDLAYWLHACSAPTDDKAMRAALATATLGLNYAVLDRLNQDERFWEAQVQRFVDYRQQWQQLGVLPMLRQMLADFDVPQRLAASVGGERALTNVLHIAEWLQRRAAELDGEHALLRALAEQIDQPSQEELLRLESDADLIKVITIHKSKGLEYPIVVMPFACNWKAQRPIKGSRRPAAYHDADGGDLVLDLSDDKDSADAYDRADDERLSEDMRLLYVAMTRARYAMWLGVAPLAQGLSRTPQVDRSAMGYLLGVASGSSIGALREALNTLAAQSEVIDVVAAPVADDVRVPPPAAPGLGAARHPVRRIAQAWHIASYSALTFGTAPERIEPSDEPVSAEEANLIEPSTEERAVLEPAERTATVQHAFERGAEAGTFLHNLLEWVARAGFSSVLERPGMLRDVIARRCRLRNLAHWIDPLQAWLTALLETPFEMPEASPLCLSALGDYQTEMEFWFSASRVDAEALDRIVCRYVLPGEPRPALLPRRIHGMFKGFIDLTFQHEGRYYVADYKSNALGPDDTAYSPTAIVQAMLANRYDMQAALYLFALHRLLRVRIPDYDYSRDVGGACYLFLRGLAAPGQGLHVERPDVAMMDELDALFMASEGAYV